MNNEQPLDVMNGMKIGGQNVDEVYISLSQDERQSNIINYSS